MDTVRSYQGLDVKGIQGYLERSKQPFDTSQLYSTETDSKFIDKDKRRSVYRQITDTELFGLVEKLVTDINEQGDDKYEYVLWRNDITHIKYDRGGFFKRHRDFNSTTSNLIEEFTLLLCVTPPDLARNVKGGETVIATYGGPNSKPAEKAFDTTTPGSALLFRKDLNHEGNVVTEGVKHIITANIFAVKKTQYEQVLLVTFPESNELKDEDNGRDIHISTSSSRAIQQAADQSNSYALPAGVLTGMLATHVQFTNRQADLEGKDHPSIVMYSCRDFSFEQFGVVVKILNRCYIDEACIEESQECIDYFGPFKAENLLVDLAVEMTHGDTADPGYEAPLNKKQKAEHSADDKANESSAEHVFDAHVIVCENEARMKAVANVARVLNEPYVPFKILFVEGMLQYFDGDGDGLTDPVDVPMIPAACLIGDNNNIFMLRSLYAPWIVSAPTTVKDVHKEQFFDCCPESFLDSIADLKAGTKVNLFDYDVLKEGFEEEGKDTCPWIFGEDIISDGLSLGLNVRLEDEDVKAGLLKFLFNQYSRSDLDPLCLRAGLDSDDSAKDTKGLSAAVAGTPLFHRDSEGKVAFTLEEAEAASSFIASIELDEKVKACLQQKRFELPQESSLVSMVFCNDDRYGKMNVLWVCGVVRLDDRKEKDSTGGEPSNATNPVHFDAWPSENAQKDMKRTMQRAYTRKEQCEQDSLPDKWWEYRTDSDESKSGEESGTDE